MERTVIVTGSSSGIGMETALYFSRMGWNVAATMRNPGGRSTKLHEVEGIDLLHLDVLDGGSIKKAVGHVKKKHGRIDVLVNNAGFPLLGPFEAAKREQIERQFDTNVFGLMDVTRELLPIMREQRGGIIINVASVGGRTTFPLYQLYNSTKWAVEGFSESLQYELRQFNIKVRIVEPGIIETQFYGDSRDVLGGKGLECYDSFVKGTLKKMDDFGAKGSKPDVIAKLIYRAATDKGWRLRYHAGKWSGPILAFRKLLPDSLFLRAIRSFTVGYE